MFLKEDGKVKFLFISLIVMLFPQIVFAHPGHAHLQYGHANWNSVWHYIESPIHLYPVVILFALFLAVLRQVKKSKKI
jgi:hypothetical protein